MQTASGSPKSSFPISPKVQAWVLPGLHFYKSCWKDSAQIDEKFRNTSGCFRSHFQNRNEITTTVKNKKKETHL